MFFDSCDLRTVVNRLHTRLLGHPLPLSAPRYCTCMTRSRFAGSVSMRMKENLIKRNKSVTVKLILRKAAVSGAPVSNRYVDSREPLSLMERIAWTIQSSKEWNGCLSVAHDMCYRHLRTRLDFAESRPSSSGPDSRHASNLVRLRYRNSQLDTFVPLSRLGHDQLSY